MSKKIRMTHRDRALERANHPPVTTMTLGNIRERKHV
jgi:hypothetical protein